MDKDHFRRVNPSSENLNGGADAVERKNARKWNLGSHERHCHWRREQGGDQARTRECQWHHDRSFNRDLARLSRSGK